MQLYAVHDLHELRERRNFQLSERESRRALAHIAHHVLQRLRKMIRRFFPKFALLTRNVDYPLSRLRQPANERRLATPPLLAVRHPQPGIRELLTIVLYLELSEQMQMTVPPALHRPLHVLGQQSVHQPVPSTIPQSFPLRCQTISTFHQTFTHDHRLGEHDVKQPFMRKLRQVLQHPHDVLSSAIPRTTWTQPGPTPMRDNQKLLMCETHLVPATTIREPLRFLKPRLFNQDQRHPQ